MKTLKKHLILFDAKHLGCFSYSSGYIAYLLFTWMFTAFILSHYTKLMSGFLPSGHDYREYIICAGQIFFQGIIVRAMCKRKAYNYLGNMMTISFGGALLLLPMMLIAQWININPLFYVGWFLIVVGLMFLEHIRRTKMMELGWTLTISWVFYRLIILLFIFFI